MTKDTQIRDSSGTIINPAVQEQQDQQSTHWQIRLTASGVIQAESSGKIVVLTDYSLSGNGGNVAGNIRQASVTGTIIWTIRALQADSVDHTFRQGLEGAAYDSAGAGNLHWEQVGNGEANFTGYLRDA